MVGSWAAASASSVAELDDALLHSPGFHDDDPSSYLLYPPGFGPVDFSLPPPSSPGCGSPSGFGGQGGDLGLAGSTMRAEVELGGFCSLDALPGQVCKVGTSDCDGILFFSGVVPHCDGTGSTGVDEYMVAGNSAEKRDVDAGVGVSGCSVSNMCAELAAERDDGIGAREVPEESDGGEIHSRCSGFSWCESGESSSSSSSSSPSTTGERSGGEEGKDGRRDDGNADEGDGGEQEIMDEDDLEEGEISASGAEVAVAVAASANGGEVAGMEGPVKPKDELQALPPPVSPREATPEPPLHELPVGVISSIMGNKVIVEGLQKHNPLNKGSVLWITKTRTPLGKVNEIFGPVKNPSYVVRYKSVEKVPAGVREGAAVSFVIFKDPKLYKKGCETSDENEVMKRSDDEKEAEHKRSPWQAKRGTDTMRHRNQESLERKSFRFDKRRVPFNTSGLHKDAKRLVPCALTPVSQPAHFPSRLQTVPRPPHLPRQMQTFTQASCFPGRLQSPPQQPSVPGQLRMGLPYRAPFLTGDYSGGKFPCFLGAEQLCPGGPPIVHTIPYGGQPGGPFGVEHQNLLMHESNAAWAHGSFQQCNMGLSTMHPGNGMPCQQPQGVHAFHQLHNQAFHHFTNGMPFQHHYGPSQGIPHTVSWQGGLPNPPVPLRYLGSTRDCSFSQAPSGRTGACEGVCGLPNGNRILAQFRPAMGQGDVHPRMKCSSRNLSVSGRPPCGHGG